MSKKEEPIRILQILPGGHICGGIENFIMNYYRNIDRSKVQFDFLVHYDEKGYYDDEIQSLGGKIYYTNVRKDKNILKYIKFLNKFFKEHREYKIIHGHMPGLAPIYFLVAKLNGVKIRIAHSHVTDTERTFKGTILKPIIKSIRFFSNVYFSCSNEAGKFMFGKRNFTVVKNAIDFEKFIFNENKRNEIRKDLKLNNEFVVGCIGRFNHQKNHTFLLDIFSEMLKTKKDSKLVLIGEGALEEKIKEKAEDLGISKNIIFLGVKDNVQDYYNVFDTFLLPTNFEGLGIVLIEAQVNSLPTYTSDVVPEETNVSKLIHYISLKNPASYWANDILSSNNERKNVIEDIEKKHYNIKVEAQILQDKYIGLLEGEDKNERNN